MNSISSMLSRYSSIEKVSDGTLFGIDWNWVRSNNRCPLCLSKLYEMRKSPRICCRSKTHKFFSIKKI